jgi:copper chaperone CopZ
MFKWNRFWMVCAGLLALACTDGVMGSDGAYPGSEGILEFRVKGVVCAMCVQSIRKRLETLSEVQRVEIDLKQGRVRVAPHRAKVLDREVVVREIEKSGYDISEDSELVRLKAAKKKEQGD